MFHPLFTPWILLSCVLGRCLAKSFVLLAALCLQVSGHNPYRSFEDRPSSWLPQQVPLPHIFDRYATVPEARCPVLSAFATESFLNPLPTKWKGNIPLEKGKNLSILDIGAQDQRTQWFLSLSGAQPMGSGFLNILDPSSQVSMGLGLRYQWSDAIALQVSATIRYVSPSSMINDVDLSKTSLESSVGSLPEASSDLSAQVNALSTPQKTSFAEGLFTIVYYFCK